MSLDPRFLPGLSHLRGGQAPILNVGIFRFWPKLHVYKVVKYFILFGTTDHRTKSDFGLS